MSRLGRPIGPRQSAALVEWVVAVGAVERAEVVHPVLADLAAAVARPAAAAEAPAVVDAEDGAAA
jgi:hypothetical protein